MKITDYKIATGSSREYLEEKVKKLMGNGWQPIGGTSLSYQAGRFYQTMVKYETDEDDVFANTVWVRPASDDAQDEHFKRLAELTAPKPRVHQYSLDGHCQLCGTQVIEL